MKLVQVQLIMAQVQIEIAWLTHFCQILVEKVPLNDVRVHCAIYESAVYQNLGQIFMLNPSQQLLCFIVKKEI